MNSPGSISVVVIGIAWLGLILAAVFNAAKRKYNFATTLFAIWLIFTLLLCLVAIKGQIVRSARQKAYQNDDP